MVKKACEEGAMEAMLSMCGGNGIVAPNSEASYGTFNPSINQNYSLLLRHLLEQLLSKEYSAVHIATSPAVLGCLEKLLGIQYEAERDPVEIEREWLQNFENANGFRQIIDRQQGCFPAEPRGLIELYTALASDATFCVSWVLEELDSLEFYTVPYVDLDASPRWAFLPGQLPNKAGTSYGIESIALSCVGEDGVTMRHHEIAKGSAPGVDDPAAFTIHDSRAGGTDAIALGCAGEALAEVGLQTWKRAGGYSAFTQITAMSKAGAERLRCTEYSKEPEPLSPKP